MLRRWGTQQQGVVDADGRVGAVVAGADDEHAQLAGAPEVIGEGADGLAGLDGDGAGPSGLEFDALARTGGQEGAQLVVRVALHRGKVGGVGAVGLLPMLR